ncbi:MAG: hypothetical protein ACXVIA_00325 [Halobacteriota archaeon]
MCDKYQMDAYKARGILPHCKPLCDDNCSNHSLSGGYCDHLYLLVQNPSDHVYKRLGIPFVEDPRALLGTQVENISKRVDKVGFTNILDRAHEISLILSELSDRGGLNVPDDDTNDLAYAVALGLFLDDPRDVIDERMLAALKALRRTLPEQFKAATTPALGEDFD